MIPGEIICSLEHRFRIQSSQPLAGGDINQVVKLITSSGTYCLKYNLAEKFPGMFEKEAAGLNLLRETGEILVPEPLEAKTLSRYSYLLLGFINSSAPALNFMYHFGISLAKLHDHSAYSYGLDHDNYMGSLPQSNRPADDWTEFFIRERLSKQVRLAHESSLIDNHILGQFDRLFSRLPRLLAPGKPALLHGDLWGGNFILSEKGEACLIDPAVYFGHREVDLAMTTLFGGFSPEFYHGYVSHFPLETGWKERLDIYNLYPLLIHLNLFGIGYLNSIQRILKKFT